MDVDTVNGLSCTRQDSRAQCRITFKLPRHRRNSTGVPTCSRRVRTFICLAVDDPVWLSNAHYRECRDGPGMPCLLLTIGLAKSRPCLEFAASSRAHGAALRPRPTTHTPLFSPCRFLRLHPIQLSSVRRDVLSPMGLSLVGTARVCRVDVCLVCRSRC